MLDEVKLIQSPSWAKNPDSNEYRASVFAAGPVATIAALERHHF
jgi:hypothetical protein